MLAAANTLASEVRNCMPSSFQLSLCQPQADEIVLSTLLSLALAHSLAQTHLYVCSPRWVSKDVVVSGRLGHPTSITRQEHLSQIRPQRSLVWAVLHWRLPWVAPGCVKLTVEAND